MSNGLAHVLRDQGVKPGDRVGVYLKKSLETAIAVYGIWKAGAAYVPFDPNAPVNRLEKMVVDGGIRHVISHQAQKREKSNTGAGEVSF